MSTEEILILTPFQFAVLNKFFELKRRGKLPLGAAELRNYFDNTELCGRASYSPLISLVALNLVKQIDVPNGKQKPKKQYDLKCTRARRKKIIVGDRGEVLQARIYKTYGERPRPKDTPAPKLMSRAEADALYRGRRYENVNFRENPEIMDNYVPGRGVNRTLGGCVGEL